MAISVAAMKRSQFNWGKFVASAATTGGLAFATGMDQWGDGQLEILGVHGASASNLGTAYNVKCIRARHIVNCTTAAHETYGTVSQLVVKGTTLSHLHAGLLGTFEGHTSGVVCNSSYTTGGHACIMARLGGHAAITATTPVSGFLAFNNASAALASGSSYAFSASVLSTTYKWTYGVYIGVGTATNPIYAAATQTSATPGTVRSIHGVATTFSTMTSGNLVGTRGEVNMAGACSSTAYLYGVQGKAITGANAFSGTALAGVYAQIDITGGTATSGHIAALQANIYGANSGTLAMEGFYLEHAGGGVINSFIQCFGKSTYVFDLASNTHNQMSTTGTPGAVTGGTGWLKVLVEGSVRYIPLASSVS